MCRKTSATMEKRAFVAPLSVCAALALAATLLPPDLHAQSCNTGLGASIGVTPAIAHVGDTITITQAKVFSSAGDCTVLNGNTWLILPDNSTVRQVMSGF